MSLDTAKLEGPYASVFDVGAFRGDFALACLAEWPDALVYCFEPLEPRPEAVKGRVVWHSVALGPENHEVMEINLCEFVPSSSMLVMTELHKDAFPYTREQGRVTVPMRALQQYAPLIQSPALLKIDVQGYELEVLRGAGPDLERFNAVALEVSHAPLYEGAPSFHLLDAFLIGAGFWWSRRLDELRHPKTGALLQSDELWLR